MAGRRPHFPWFGEQPGLRWATHWAGGYDHERTAHWLERGVLPLAWKWGTNLPGEWDEDKVYQMDADIGEAAGIAVDECGYYPTPEGIERFATYTHGMARAKRERPDSFFLMWHCGSFYPEQAALYRDACDLVVLESYVFRFAPQGLGTEQVYDFLDMKMVPARQVDMLGPTGSGPQVITSVDLDPETFDRGMFEGVVRHLRQTWPEMRGLGLFGSCLGEAAEGQPRPGMEDNRFVDRLCHDYFILPVITILPGNLWVNREDDGSWRVAAAVSNIGGMHSGPVEVKLYADDELLNTVELASIPAGDNRLENQTIVETRWQATSGHHEFVAQITQAPGSTVLESRAQLGRHTP